MTLKPVCKQQRGCYPRPVAHSAGAILPSPMARVSLGGCMRLGREPQTANTMIKRFLIAAILVALFLGGRGNIKKKFKQQMVAGFMAKMVAPPATVTAERAGTKEWIDRVHSIGTLTAIRGVEVAPEIAG